MQVLLVVSEVLVAVEQELDSYKPVLNDMASPPLPLPFLQPFGF